MNTKPTTSLSSFWDMLNKADWFYEMSDDQSVWRRGREEFGKFQSIAKESPEHQKLYDDFKKHIWGKIKDEDYPKPEKPMDKVFRTGESYNG